MKKKRLSLSIQVILSSCKLKCKLYLIFVLDRKYSCFHLFTLWIKRNRNCNSRILENYLANFTFAASVLMCCSA